MWGVGGEGSEGSEGDGAALKVPCVLPVILIHHLAPVVAESRAQGRKLEQASTASVASNSGQCEGFECKITELFYKIHEIVSSKIDLWHSHDTSTKFFMTPVPGKGTSVDILKGDGSTMSFHYPSDSHNAMPTGQPDMNSIMNDKSFLDGLHTKFEDIKLYLKENLHP